MTTMENHKYDVKDKPKLTFWQNFKLYGNDYAANTSVHGVRYMGETRRHLEKLWWICVFTASFYLCSNQILLAYKRWCNTPIISTFGSVWKVPFPAVTVCPDVKMLRYNYTEVFWYHVVYQLPMNKSEIEMFESMSLLCDTFVRNTPIAPKNFDVFWSCEWNNQIYNCADYWKPLLTKEGVCYSFNMLDRDDIYTDKVSHFNDFQKHNMDREGWALEYGYKSDVDTYPKRAMSTKPKYGLTIRLFSFNYDFDLFCRDCRGFKVSLHNPIETPRMMTNYFWIPLEQELLVAVTPDMVNTSDLLRNYSPDERGCYFSLERPLQFYKNYTQENCEVECLANFTINRCGCVEFYMPHVAGTKICGTGKSECVLDAEVALNQINSDACHCIPACTSLTYKHEVDQAPYEWRELFNSYNYTNPYKSINYAAISIYIKENQFIQTEREVELYGIADFLARCGGILNLFFGFSVLSLVEIIYFLTLWLFNTVRQYGKRLWFRVKAAIADNDEHH